jgi:hypothetical protein
MIERIARFEQIRNDLFWTLYDVDSGEFIRWRGYDDAYWWGNVSKTDEFRIRGKYRLDPITNKVIIIENKE